jgi:hypothetical protein
MNVSSRGNCSLADWNISLVSFLLLDICCCICYNVIVANDCVLLGILFPYGTKQFISFFWHLTYAVEYVILLSKQEIEANCAELAAIFQPNFLAFFHILNAPRAKIRVRRNAVITVAVSFTPEYGDCFFTAHLTISVCAIKIICHLSALSDCICSCRSC